MGRLFLLKTIIYANNTINNFNFKVITFYKFISRVDTKKWSRSNQNVREMEPRGRETDEMKEKFTRIGFSPK